MKLKPYAEILKMTKEAVTAALAPVRAMQAKSQAKLETSKLEEIKVTLEAEIEELCMKHPIPFDTIIEKMDKLALTERKQKQFEKITTELFPE